MKHTFKICATLLLALVLVLSVGLLVSCDDDKTPDTDAPQVDATAAERGGVVASGDCPDGLTWTVYESGELALAGECTDGAMHVYEDSIPGWKAYASKVTGLTLDNSIISISADAFSSMKNLVWVQFGTGVQSIGENAFRSCSNLRRVIMPSSVKTVGAHAFNGCFRMYELRMTDTVSSIGAYAFSGCTNLVSVTFPKKTSVGNGAFADTFKLVEVITSNTDVVAGSEDLGGVALHATGGVHTADKASIITINDNGYILKGKTLVGYTGSATEINSIPAEVNQIGDYAFYGNTAITSVDVGNTVAAIGAKAFANCTGVKTVTIGKAVKNIATGAFDGCGGIESVVFNATAYSTTNKTEGIFENCISLTTVTFASDVANLPSGGGLFRGCTALKKVTIPAVTNIPASMFEGCTALEEVTFNAKNKNIGDNAFKNCSALSKIDLTQLAASSTISSGAFEGCSAILTADLTKVSKVEESAFNYCTSLTGVVTGATFNTVTGKSSFDGCIKLIDVVNNSTKVITPGATNNGGIARYTSFEIGKGESRLLEDNGFLFFKTADTNYLVGYVGTESNLTLPATYDGKTYAIYNNAFSNNNKIVNVTIGAGVTSIGAEAFRKCARLASVDFTGSTISTIPAYTFDGCTGLVTVTLSNGITEVGEYAFRECTSLGEVNLKNVANIGIRAFQGSGVTKLVAGTTLTAIPNDVFSGCARLAEVNIPSVVTIGNQAFANCVSLVKVNMPAATTLGEYAFYRNIVLAKVELPAGVIIGQGAFQECGGMMALTLGENMTTICESAFKDCGKLVYILNKSAMSLNKGEMGPGYVTRNAEMIVTSSSGETFLTEGDYSYIVVDEKTYLIAYTGTATEITLPATLGGNAYDIYRFAFWGSPVTKVTVSEGVKVIGVSAFAYSSVEHVSLPASLRSIHDSAFEGSALRTIEIKNGVESIGYACFKYCRELQSITLPDSVKTIGISLFRDCVSLREVNLSANITKIEDFTFDGCISLPRIVIKNTSTKFGRRWFWGCNALLEVYYKGGTGLASKLTLNDRDINIAVTTGSTAKMFTDENGFLFYNYNGVNYLAAYYGTDKDVVLPETCKGAAYQIFDYAFYNCDFIETIRIPDRVTGIGSYAFAECDNLKGVYLPTTVSGKFGVGENLFWGCSRTLVVATGFAGVDALPAEWNVEFNVQGEASAYKVVYGVTYDLFTTMLK